MEICIKVYSWFEIACHIQSAHSFHTDVQTLRITQPLNAIWESNQTDFCKRHILSIYSLPAKTLILGF